MTIAVIGLGLIGGSMAKAIQAKTAHTVLGYDICDKTLSAAREAGVIDEVAEDDFSAADLILVALFPTASVEFMRRHRDSFRPGALVVDLCGVKRVVCRQAEELFQDTGVTFIGGHPMAGRECFGFESSLPTLYDNASMILTPGDSTPKEQLDRAERFFLSLGFGGVTITTPERHDEIIAYTSQLAHVVSSAYVQSPSAREHMGFSAGSFKDLTRVAKLNEEMWTELFLLNGDCLAGEIDTIIGNLTRLRDSIAGTDADTLRGLLRHGRESKEFLNEQEALRKANR